MKPSAEALILHIQTNSENELSWVALEQNCSGEVNPIYNNETASGTFYSKTLEVPAGCEYTVYGPGFADERYP